MDYDKKVFWRFVWHDQLKISNWINNSVFYEYIMMFTILYTVIFSSLDLRQKAILFMGFLIGISIIKFYALYKSGQHRFWNRKIHGVPSKSYIKKLKNDQRKKIEMPERVQKKETEKITQKEKEGRNNSPKEIGVLGI